MADYHYLSLFPFSCKSQKYTVDSKINSNFLVGNEVPFRPFFAIILPLTYYFHLNVILDSSKLQILTATSDICSCRYSYYITAAQFNLFSALSGLTSHADKPLPLHICERRIFCGRDTSNSLLARRKACFRMH